MLYLKQNVLQEWVTFLIGSQPYRYRCWHRSSEQWCLQGKTYHTFGTIHVVFGLISMVITGLILCILRSHSLMKSTCYKILLALGMISWFSVGTLSIWPGFMSIRGTVFCNYPFLGMIAGRSLTLEWVAGSSLCLFLAFNRIADMTRNKILLKFFDKPIKVLFTFSSIFLYSSSFAFITDPCLYNSSLRGYSINPYNEEEPDLFSNIWIHFHNVSFIIFLSIIAVVVVYKLCTDRENCWRGTSDLQRKLLLQSIFISTQYLIPCFVYLISYFWSTAEQPQCFIEGSHVWMEVTAGFNGVVCLFFNRPIRVKFLKEIGLKNYVIQPNKRTSAPSVTRSVM
ncbi:hypothetical protein CAEBREN_19658 [Caenorhabditis brenneri]|uniref:Uncharacterized protein n=1 Tax=Caenorhabditis brenneri TaxID=135651 RepID=G0NKW7_CAEBE|nr:hypothetical protein CAEBREN_19658 [Caenorhabditis brenneri]